MKPEKDTGFVPVDPVAVQMIENLCASLASAKPTLRPFASRVSVARVYAMLETARLEIPTIRAAIRRGFPEVVEEAEKFRRNRRSEAA